MSDILQQLLDILIKKEQESAIKMRKLQESRAQRRRSAEDYNACPPAPRPKGIRQWLRFAWDWYLRQRGLKGGQVYPHWNLSFTFRELSRQEKCMHRKGMTGYQRPVPYEDYNVNMHTFIDGKSRIRCLSCGWSVWNLPEFSFKWAEGMKMVRRSSNTPSSSEVIQNPQPNRKGGEKAIVTMAQARKTTYDPETKGQPDNPIRGIVQPKKEIAG